MLHTFASRRRTSALAASAALALAPTVSADTLFNVAGDSLTLGQSGVPAEPAGVDFDGDGVFGESVDDNTFGYRIYLHDLLDARLDNGVTFVGQLADGPDGGTAGRNRHNGESGIKFGTAANQLGNNTQRARSFRNVEGTGTSVPVDGILMLVGINNLRETGSGTTNTGSFAAFQTAMAATIDAFFDRASDLTFPLPKIYVSTLLPVSQSEEAVRPSNAWDTDASNADDLNGNASSDPLGERIFQWNQWLMDDLIDAVSDVYDPEANVEIIDLYGAIAARTDVPTVVSPEGFVYLTDPDGDPNDPTTPSEYYAAVPQVHDGLHPNDALYRVMAEIYADAIAPIPEPTSALIAFAGVGLLGLRRRRGA